MAQADPIDPHPVFRELEDDDVHSIMLVDATTKAHVTTLEGRSWDRQGIEEMAVAHGASGLVMAYACDDMGRRLPGPVRLHLDAPKLPRAFDAAAAEAAQQSPVQRERDVDTLEETRRNRAYLREQIADLERRERELEERQRQATMQGKSLFEQLILGAMSTQLTDAQAQLERIRLDAEEARERRRAEEERFQKQLEADRERERLRREAEEERERLWRAKLEEIETRNKARIAEVEAERQAAAERAKELEFGLQIAKLQNKSQLQIERAKSLPAEIQAELERERLEMERERAEQEARPSLIGVLDRILTMAGQGGLGEEGGEVADDDPFDAF